LYIINLIPNKSKEKKSGKSLKILLGIPYFESFHLAFESWKSDEWNSSRINQRKKICKIEKKYQKNREKSEKITGNTRF